MPTATKACHDAGDFNCCGALTGIQSTESKIIIEHTCVLAEEHDGEHVCGCGGVRWL